MLKTKAIGLHHGLENDQAGPAESPQPPPSLNRGCQSECRTTTQAAAQASWVRFLPSVLHSDSSSSEFKNGFSQEEGSFLAMLTKYILVKNVWDGLNQQNTGWIHPVSLNGHIKSCIHQLSFGVRKPNQPYEINTIQGGHKWAGSLLLWFEIQQGLTFKHSGFSLCFWYLNWVHSNFQ